MLLNVNGKLLENYNLELNNRSFRYGDGLFEQLKLFKGKIFNSKHHLIRLESSLNLLQLQLSFSVQEIFDQVEVLAQKNHLYSGSTARISIYRNGGGLYTPESNQATYCIEVSENIHSSFLLNKLRHLGLYNQNSKNRSQLSQIKSSSAQFYVLASLYKKEHNFDDVLVINDNRAIIEATSSNLFIVKDKQIVTPPLADGPIAGCLRALIIDNFDVVERSIFEEDLIQSQEVFLSNCNGLRWVESFLGQEVYANKKSIEITEFLNALI